MYSIKLDENKFFTGSYAKVGKVEGGVNIPTLPPDMDKAKFYKYDYHEVTYNETIFEPIFHEETGEPVLDEDGNPTYREVEQPATRTILGWVFDDNKYQEFLIQDMELIRELKINEMSEICQSTIYAGVDVETSMGIEHFSLQFHDQIEIFKQHTTALAGAEYVPYHSDDSPCRMFTREEMLVVGLECTGFVEYNRTYFNYLKQFIKRLQTENEINSIVWGTPLPEDLDMLLVDITGKSSIK